MARRFTASLVYICLVSCGWPLDAVIHRERSQASPLLSFLYRSFTNIQERYGPYVAGALFVLKQGGAVKYGSSGDRVWERGRAPLLSNGCVVGASLLDFSLSFKRRR